MELNEKLIDLGKRMNAQDNRSTQLPLFIVVADEENRCSEEDGELKRIDEDSWDPNKMCGYCGEKWELNEEVDDYCEDCDDEMFCSYKIEKQVPQLEHGVFLTAEECDEYIERRSYAMKDNAVSFGISAHRSEEMTEVLRFLSALGSDDNKAKNWYT